MNGIVIRNGRVIDPANNRDEVGDVVVIDGKIAEPAQLSTPQLSTR